MATIKWDYLTITYNLMDEVQYRIFEIVKVERSWVGTSEYFDIYDGDEDIGYISFNENSRQADGLNYLGRYELARTASARTAKIYIESDGDIDHKKYLLTSISVPARTQYLVIYNLNGGSGSFPNQTKDKGATITLRTGTPTKTGDTFVDWRSGAYSGNMSYSPGDTYSTDADLVLKARWQVWLSYNTNGGAHTPVSQTDYYTWTALTFTLSDVTPTRSQYVFWHWNTKTDNSGTTVSPSGTIRISTSTVLYAIWNPIISYNANGGTNAPSSQIKTFNSDIRLSYSTPKRDGYTFSGWNTKANGSGTAYKPNEIYASNVALTLYAQWTKVIINPTISSMSVVRCDSSGTAADDGTYFKLTVQWSVDTTYPDSNPATVAGRYKASGTSQWTSITFSSGASGTSGTAVAIVSGVSTDDQYDVEVTVTDSHSLTASRIDILTRAKFVWDIKAGGEAMGIGSAAPQKGLEVGWKAQFDEDVTLLKNLVVGGSLTAQELTVNTYSIGIVVAATNGTVVSQSARSVGHLCMVYVGLRPANSVSAGSTVTLGTLQSGFRPALTQGFASTAGTGTVSSGGSISFRPFNALSTSSTVYVGLTFLK